MAADTNRVVYETAPRRLLPVASATVIDIGDMLFWDAANNAVIPVSTASLWNASEAATQREVAGRFAGIALHASASGETSDALVATRGVARMPCASATFVADELIGIEKASGNTLEPQKVQKVTDPAAAIGQVVKGGTSVTAVTFEFAATMFSAPLGLSGGIQVLKDPGDAGDLDAELTAPNAQLVITTADVSGETRTIGDPKFVGQRLTIHLGEDGGDVTITFDSPVNQAGNATAVSQDEGDHLALEGTIQDLGGTANYEWRVLANDGWALS
jgi:hypothetical protein